MLLLAEQLRGRPLSRRMAPDCDVPLPRGDFGVGNSPADGNRSCNLPDTEGDRPAIIMMNGDLVSKSCGRPHQATCKAGQVMFWLRSAI